MPSCPCPLSLSQWLILFSQLGNPSPSLSHLCLSSLAHYVLSDWSGRLLIIVGVLASPSASASAFAPPPSPRDNGEKDQAGLAGRE